MPFQINAVTLATENNRLGRIALIGPSYRQRIDVMRLAVAVAVPYSEVVIDTGRAIAARRVGLIPAAVDLPLNTETIAGLGAPV